MRLRYINVCDIHSNIKSIVCVHSIIINCKLYASVCFMLALHTNTMNCSYYTACTRNVKPNQLNMCSADKYKARLLGNAWGICGTRCTPTNHSTAAS